MRVAILKADSYKLELVDNWQYSYENLRDAVGGYIQAISIDYDKETQREITVWLNEEGKLKNLAPNFAMMNGDNIVDIVVGDVIITSVDSEGITVGLNDDEVEVIDEKFEIGTGRGVLLGDIFLEKLLHI